LRSLLIERVGMVVYMLLAWYDKRR
jgi:hypothetical protein